MTPGVGPQVASKSAPLRCSLKDITDYKTLSGRIRATRTPIPSSWAFKGNEAAWGISGMGLSVSEALVGWVCQ